MTKKMYKTEEGTIIELENEEFNNMVGNAKLTLIKNKDKLKINKKEMK